MDIVIYRESSAAAAECASIIGNLLRRKPAAVLGLATGNTPLALYRRLIADYKKSKVSFRSISTFNLDEYVGLKPEAPQSYRSYMRREFFDHIDIDIENTFLPECGAGRDPQEVGRTYEALIESRGGIDLQVLGIGQNGHIGFNEPTSSLASRTRIKTLTRETIAANSRYFDDTESQPETAMTMGIATILEARRIVLLAIGEEKAEAVRQLIEGPVSAMWPATVLQTHEQVTVLLDAAAASALEKSEYYYWIAEQKRRLLGPRDDQ
jgi:glucosamine-6-phosphate deaminase